ncbi:MAG TPA: hypothetical protein PK987_01775 [Ferruginibacter sp.]|nr:hypothetical protein [Ferruginibacter sp.]
MNQVKTFITVAIISMLAFSQQAVANTVDNTNALSVELTFAGTFKSQPLVQLNFTSNEEDNVFKIVITDESGIELYNTDVKGTVFSKQFLLDTDDLGDAVLYFEITGKKSGKKTIFEVNRQQQVTQKVNVIKL